MDPFASFASTPLTVGKHHFAVTPDDGADLPIRPRALYCAVDGNVVLTDEDGVDLTYPVVAGQVLEFSPIRVKATGTTATVIGWW
ncbi:hypothetical protein [Devosia sp.]|uniref:spike base protein, RCAP_Rcc01079 family n=1 Tax=Devosia sp. TaxID=1871048 RepID=UPI001AC4E867|nr:hypothetical protein [Devosia sp.]MBN9335373.1 hypothetical protein [Devosia sp.]